MDKEGKLLPQHLPFMCLSLMEVRFYMGCESGPPYRDHQGVCIHCGKDIIGLLPVEPLWDLKTTASLLPMTRASLNNWLSKNKAKLDEPRYLRTGKSSKHKRVLTSREVRVIRESIELHRGANGKMMSVWNQIRASQEFLEYGRTTTRPNQGASP